MKSQIKVRSERDRIFINFEYDSHLLSIFRSFKNKKFDKNTKEHSIPISHRNWNRLFNELPVKLKDYEFIFDKTFKDLR